MKTTEQILDARALGERLGLSREAIYRRRSLGQNMPPAIRIGSLLRWRSEDVDEWLEGCLESAPAGVGGIAAIAYLSVICTVVGYTLWVEVMKHVPVGVMLFTVFVQPVVGPFIAAAALGEPIDGRILTGGAFLIGGMLVSVVGHLRAAKKLANAASDPAVEMAGTV